MDALSDLFRIVGLTGGVFVEAEFTDPWWVAGRIAPEYCKPFMVEPEHVVCFHYVVEGQFDIEIESGARARVTAGEIVMVPMNDLHHYGSVRRRDPVTAADLMQPVASGFGRIEYGGGGARTRLVCGFLGGNAQIYPLLSGLPRLMTAQVASLPAGDWMRTTFEYAARTLAAGDPGAATVLAKMSELLFVEAVRAFIARMPEGGEGWLAGLRDPYVGKALALIHGATASSWSADSLASEVGLSRSAFADRFTQIIGSPPMRYLTQWRMRLAATRLAEGRMPIARIGEAAGYESEAAFARAFRREMGKPPGQWRKDAAGGAVAKEAARTRSALSADA